MSSYQSKRWVPLFFSLFFVIFLLVPVQYEGPEAQEAGISMDKGLEVKLPHFQSFGFAILVKHLYPDTIGSRMPPAVQPYKGEADSVPAALAHIVFLTFILSHLGTIFIGKNFFRLRDDQTTFFSMAYFKVLLGSVFAAILLGLDAWSLFDAALRHPDFFLWLEENTNVHDASYATLWGTSMTVVTTLLITAAREQQCPTILQKIYYFIEAFIILEIIFNCFTNIDVILFLLSHPFPAFSPDFNPFHRSWFNESPDAGVGTVIERLMRDESQVEPIGL